MEDHEQAFVAAFITLERQQRYLELFASSKSKGRKKILDRLNHRFDLDYSLAERAPSNECFAPTLERILKAKGAGAMCHIIADTSDLDGSTLPLGEALEFALSHDLGVVLSCVPGRLAVYKSEAPGPVYILEHR
jgi:hypothetical protein